MPGKTDYAKLHKRFVEYQRRAAEMDDDRWLRLQTPQVGAAAVTYRMRFLPPPDGYDSWYLEYGVHYQIKNEAGQYTTITCPQKTQKKPCPICEFTKGLWRSGAEEDKVLARRIGVKTRYVSNVVNLSNPSEVKLWSYGAKVWTPLNELCVGDSGEIVPIDDPQKGYNIKIVVKAESTPEGSFPNYTVLPEMKPCPIPDMGVLNKIHPMHEIIVQRVKSYDEIRSILFGAEDSAAPSTSPPESEVAVETSEPAVVNEGIEEETAHAAPEETQKREDKRPSADELVRRAKAMLAKRASGA
jgi:hypothetical protein